LPLSTQVVYNRKHPIKASTRKTQTTKTKQNPPKKIPLNTKTLKPENPQTPTTLKLKTHTKQSTLKNVTIAFPTPRGHLIGGFELKLVNSVGSSSFHLKLKNDQLNWGKKKGL
jgi:hypothetical protein